MNSKRSCGQMRTLIAADSSQHYQQQCSKSKACQSVDNAVGPLIDAVVMSGNSIVKRYEVKRWGSTVEGDPDAAKKLSAQLLRHAAGKTNDVPDFQYIVPNLLHAQRIVEGLSQDAIDAFKESFGADITFIEAGVRRVNPDFFKVVA